MNPWLAAARPRTLPAAIVPVIVAAAAASRDGVFDWLPLVLTLTGALAIQVAANFANDASDAKRGADPADRLGPPRMVASGRITSSAMWTACWAAVAIAAVSGVLMALRVGPVILLIGLASVLAMLTYVGGPFPYGYRGLGEVFVLLFFGVFATAGSRLAYDGRCPQYVWWLGVPIGMLAAGILMANNLRDLPTDSRVGKRTLAVRLGKATAERVFFVTLWSALGSTVLLALMKVEPAVVAIGTAAGTLIIPLHFAARDDQQNYVPLLGGTVRVHFVYGLLVAMGLLIETATRSSPS